MSRVKVEDWPITRLSAYARNARTHSAEQVAQIAASIQEFGWTNPILADGDGQIIAGHGRLLAARRLGLQEVPVIVLAHLTEDQKRALVLADNKLALNAGWDDALLARELQDLIDSGFNVDLTGFGEDEIAEIIAGVEAEEGGVDEDADLDEVPDEPQEPVTELGDVWILGRHRLHNGDSTQPDQVRALLAGRVVDAIVTDPPYCSGGFQEAGRSSGSIGSRSKTATRETRQSIANDKLSTRGYGALMKAVLGAVEAPILYAFTDWRMWINLYDVAESSGYGVRNMVVWDKGTPGMGMGWRTQHELCLFGARESVKFDPHKSQGNVIKSGRTGNPLHPTQKPVDLMRAILAITDMANVIYEPFGGSGTTLIACEAEGRTCCAMELSSAFVDIIVSRWQQATGLVATLESSGETFVEVMARRRPGAQIRIAELKPERGRKAAKAETD